MRSDRGAATQSHRLDLESDGFDSRIELDGADPSLHRAELLNERARVLQGLGKLGQPGRALGRGNFKRYSTHCDPPVFSARL
jgi:hypothetical protein